MVKIRWESQGFVCVEVRAYLRFVGSVSEERIACLTVNVVLRKECGLTYSSGRVMGRVAAAAVALSAFYREPRSVSIGSNVGVV